MKTEIIRSGSIKKEDSVYLFNPEKGMPNNDIYKLRYKDNQIVTLRSTTRDKEARIGSDKAVHLIIEE